MNSEGRILAKVSAKKLRKSSITMICYEFNLADGNKRFFNIDSRILCRAIGADKPNVAAFKQYYEAIMKP